MHILRSTEVVKEDIFEGRNSEWFQNLLGHGYDDEYDHLHLTWGFPDVKPEVIEGHKTDEYKENKDGYFGFNHILVDDFLKWFEKYRPDLKAGWCSTYDKWRIEKKGYIPDYLPREIESKDDLVDAHFVEYIDKYECSRWLYNYLSEEMLKGDINEDDIIMFWFDW